MSHVVDYDHVRGYSDPSFQAGLLDALRDQGCFIMRLPGSESTAAKLTAALVSGSLLQLPSKLFL